MAASVDVRLFYHAYTVEAKKKDQIFQGFLWSF